MNNAREQILAKLAGRRTRALNTAYQTPVVDSQSIDDPLEMFVQHLQAAQAQVYQLERAQLSDWLSQQLQMLDAKSVWIGHQLLENLGIDSTRLEAEVSIYDQAIETCKSDLFDQADVGITTVAAGIASSGSLVLWPSESEPRLLSLVPPVHIAIIFKEQIYQTFSEVMQAQDWQTGLPSNVVLVSGPSKTADIEQVLAYGVHGPRRLITLIIT